MSDQITLTINGKTVQAKDGDVILNIARANDIFIPAICYLTRCSPTLACRLCLVEINGKQVYSCNAKAKEGMIISTDTPNIAKERRAIMEVYDVNHPLQCGVCDQSGECELQNYTLYMKVDSQNYSIKDVLRPAANWGVMKYDPGLCIVCEKCVTVCKDMVGSSALSTIKRDADTISKTFKDEMPKDAYTMWNKLNKSLIGFDEKACTDCGECISVCPVGALVSSDFQYKSNAWELNRVPASNPHSSDCAFMYYEIKHHSIEDTKQIIYRVTNEHHYSTLNGAARFAYDFENRVQGKDKKSFNDAIEAFKKAKSIKFNSYITNEEALILQKIATKTGAKLVNKDAYNYKKFLKAYGQVTGESLYSSSLKDVHDSNFVISVGSYLKSDLPNARYALNNSVVTNKGAALYFHPLKDPIMEKIGKRGKSTEFVYHKPLCEESILYLILSKFGKDLPSNLQEYIDSQKESRTKTVVETIKETVIEIVKDEETGEEKELKKIVAKEVEKEVSYEYTKLLDKIGQDESLLSTIDTLLAKKDTFSLLIGEDLITHPNSENLAKLCGFINMYTEFNILIIPSQTNTLGVSLICDLSSTEEGYTVGYNEKANFQLSALGDGDLDMPALNQQEGTFTNIDKKLIPTNAALPYYGYVLNDIANVILEDDIEHTIEYTEKLPETSGFKVMEFDKLANNFGNDRSENRGYDILSLEIEKNEELLSFQNEVLEASNDEVIIYRANPINQFNEFTAISHEFASNLKSGLFASKDLLDKLEIKQGDKVQVNSNGVKIEVNVYHDDQIAGDIAYISTFEKSLETQNLFNTYRYSTAVIKKA